MNLLCPAFALLVVIPAGNLLCRCRSSCHSRRQPAFTSSHALSCRPTTSGINSSHVGLSRSINSTFRTRAHPFQLRFPRNYVPEILEVNQPANGIRPRHTPAMLYHPPHQIIRHSHVQVPRSARQHVHPEVILPPHHGNYATVQDSQRTCPQENHSHTVVASLVVIPAGNLLCPFPCSSCCHSRREPALPFPLPLPFELSFRREPASPLHPYKIKAT